MLPETGNPYAAPQSDPIPGNAGVTGSVLATRGERFLAVLLDGVANLAVYFVVRKILVAAGVVLLAAPALREIPAARSSPADPLSVFLDRQFSPYTLLVAFLGNVIFFAIHWHFLRTRGQTLGKKMMKIKIVTLADEKPAMRNLVLKRYLPLSCLRFLPIAGGFLGLLDVLFVFRDDRRCLHDFLAGTKVVKELSKT